MVFDCDLYYGYIIKGDLKSAITYIKQFPEKCALYNRFASVFEHEQYISYEVDADLNEILLTYQQYYRDVFYLCIAKEQAENELKERLAKLLGVTNEHIELCELEQKHLVDIFESRGLHFLGGKTSGYYGPYIWRTTETVSYDVELPDGLQSYFRLTRPFMVMYPFAAISSFNFLMILYASDWDTPNIFTTSSALINKHSAMF